MIRQILSKDVLENVLSLRFVLSLLLTVSLFAASAFVFVGRYSQQTQEYWRKTNDNRSGLREASSRLYALAFRPQKAFLQPKPLTFCVEGFEKSLPHCLPFTAFTSELPEIEGRGNFVLPPFSDIDWVFIISMILSFVALVFTYDSICGEKEQGTLRLILAGAVSRPKVLLGKYCAAMCTLGIPLGMGLLVSLVVVGSSRDVAISLGEWPRILVIILLSFMYLSIFVLLGLSVSSRTAHSADSMVILLLAWVGLGILVPSLGRIVSDLSCPKLTKADLQRRLDEAKAQIWAGASQFGNNAGSMMSYDPHDPRNNPPARARLKTALTNARNHILDDHHNRMLAQVSAGDRITRISPARVYQRASEAIAGTGISHCVSWRRQVMSYQDDLRRYVRDEDGKDPNSLHLIFDEVNCALRWKTISHQPVPFDTVPEFQERDLALGESLRLALGDIGLLALFNVVFFAAAFVSFLRYDVR